MAGKISRDFGYSRVAYYEFRFRSYWKEPKLWKQRRLFIKELLKNDFNVELFINPNRIHAVKDEEIFSIDLYEDTGASILPVKFVKDPGNEPVYMCDIPAQGQTLDSDSTVGILNRRPKHLRLLLSITDATIFPIHKHVNSLVEEILNPKPVLIKYLIECHARDCQAQGEYQVSKLPRSCSPQNISNQIKKQIPDGWSFQWKDLNGNLKNGVSTVVQSHFFCSPECYEKGCESFLYGCPTKTQDVWEQPEALP